VADGARNALVLEARQGFASMACPMIGAGTGGLPERRVIDILHESITAHPYEGRVLLVRHGVGVPSALAAAAESMA
jgi:O-acetyl-ADP-ribose deacetylase (regulator of RNase III)